MLGERSCTSRRLPDPLPSAEQILRYRTGPEEIFVRMYWKISDRDIWQGLVFEHLLFDDADGTGTLEAGITFHHSPSDPLFDWTELTRFQLLLAEDGMNWETEEEETRLEHIFRELDFCITMFCGEHPVLVTEGLKSIQYDGDEDYIFLNLRSCNDVEAKIAISEEEFHLVIYKETIETWLEAMVV